MNIYVGNLSRQTAEDDVRHAFESFGQVSTVILIKDKISGEPRGFGFVKMSSDDEGNAAITGLHGKELDGKMLNVNEARPRVEGR
jgi:RNA recognition motif-containing protein